jgi:glycosyltransferase involved in cell wall biosynthesis
MKIAIIAPTHKSFTARLLNMKDDSLLPEGYFGAPFLSDIIEGLLSRGHEIIAITTSFSDNFDFSVKTFQYNKFTWVVVPMRKHAFRFNKFKLGRMLDFFAVERKWMTKAVEDNKPDIIHAHWGYEFAHVAISSKRPYLVSLHDNPFVILKYSKHLYRFFRLIYAEFLLPKIKYKSTVSPYMLKYASNGIGECRLIPNPIKMNYTKTDVIEFVERRIQTLSSSPNFIMIINGWDSRKNGKNGLLAFQLIQSKIPGASLHLFGRGTEQGGSACKDGSDLNLSNVYYNGITDRMLLINKMKEMHVLLHTALEESFGVVLIEAMSIGLPAIGGKQSGAVPWVINKPELLTDVTDPTQIASTALACINNYRIDSIDCYDNVFTRFSAKMVTEQYEKYYYEILANY